jgi:Ser/Thr protein kinase RdoA (MazF antagonist)
VDKAAIGKLIGAFRIGPSGREGTRLLSSAPAEGRVACRVSGADGGSWVVRIVRADQRPHASFAGSGASTLRELAVSHIATLEQLDAYGYPAPRVVPTADGQKFAEEDGLLAYAVTFLPGQPITPTLAQLRELGAALARLHSLPSGAAGRSSWNIEQAAISTRSLLGRLDAAGADGYGSVIEQLSGALRGADQLAALGETLIHGDAWSANCIGDGERGLALVDWDTGGQGTAMVDLGRSLLECHLDSATAPGNLEAWLISPSQERISALVAGYRSHRTPGPAEIEALPAAMMFPIAVIGAIHLTSVLGQAQRGGPGYDPLARLRNRLQVAGAVAAAAQRELRRAAPLSVAPAGKDVVFSVQRRVPVADRVRHGGAEAQGSDLDRFVQPHDRLRPGQARVSRIPHHRARPGAARGLGAVRHRRTRAGNLRSVRGRGL